MKQFLFSFITEHKQWDERIEADGMMDASRKVRAKLREYGTPNIRVQYKGIYYPPRATG
ncbi:hypothetical protein G4V62_11020 [Bacillaceae bacterium SIJ1]|uniref:hypothetical protein n=1 Tax=Litoribacterium kuwaitense TaxID=1398745 RepID=UPI0013EDCB43|nr:hypothetical protein [Litoribacterium kuwaitense]NGP45463.1 hypothetical protein [Litoribacterium kuwaitense]